MITSIGQSIDSLKDEYGLDRDLVIEAMKEAVLAAARKQFKSEYKSGEGLLVDWNDEEGMVEISAQKTVVEEVENESIEVALQDAIELTGDDELELGDVLEFPLPTEELGRIAAQTAKQILIQKVREAIRERVYEEFIDRKGELVNGLVKRFERGDIIVDLGSNLEAILPKREQTRGETWSINDRIRVVIEDVNKDLRGQQVVASRASAELLKRLFEMEVPEIYDDTVIIKSAVREPGDRAKIAVSSNEKDVDPVGACVGMKGSRVQSIIKELRGEKIDIIEWSDEPSVFAANALSPAKVSQVRITDINERKMEVIVTEDQLSLAIGKRGQNVRLATRLVGWDIDIVSEEVLKQEITQQMGEMMASGEAVPISALEGVTTNYAETLSENGIEDIETLANTELDNLVEILDISIDEGESILNEAKQVVSMKDAQAETVEDTEEGEVQAEQANETEESKVEAEGLETEGVVGETESLEIEKEQAKSDLATDDEVISDVSVTTEDEVVTEQTEQIQTESFDKVAESDTRTETTEISETEAIEVEESSQGQNSEAVTFGQSQSVQEASDNLEENTESESEDLNNGETEEVFEKTSEEE